MLIQTVLIQKVNLQLLIKEDSAIPECHHTPCSSEDKSELVSSAVINSNDRQDIPGKGNIPWKAVKATWSPSALTKLSQRKMRERNTKTCNSQNPPILKTYDQN